MEKEDMLFRAFLADVWLGCDMTEAYHEFVTEAFKCLDTSISDKPMLMRIIHQKGLCYLKDALNYALDPLTLLKHILQQLAKRKLGSYASAFTALLIRKVATKLPDSDAYKHTLDTLATQYVNHALSRMDLSDVDTDTVRLLALFYSDTKQYNKVLQITGWLSGKEGCQEREPSIESMRQHAAKQLQLDTSRSGAAGGPGA